MEDDKSLNDLLAKLKGDSKVMMTILLKQFKELREDFVKSSAAKDKEIGLLKNEVKTLKQNLGKLEATIDDQDAYERRDTVIVSGNSLPEVSPGENCSDIVRQVIKEKLKIELPPTEINTIHRLGRKPMTQTPDKRPFIIKLCRRDTKKELLQAAKEQHSTSPIYINESLTPKRSTILYTLRQIKKAHPSLVTGCTSIDGRVFAFTKSTTPGGRNARHLVNHHAGLVDFCRDYVKKPLDTFLAEWAH